MKNIMKVTHSGIGGLYFITTSILMSATVFIVLQLSWKSQAVAMADNISYIVSINTTVHNYVSNAQPYEKENPTIVNESTGNKYNPLNDFNSMAMEAGLAKSAAKTAKVTWNGKSTTIQIGEFDTSLNQVIRPHRQESIVEDN